MTLLRNTSAHTPSQSGAIPLEYSRWRQMEWLEMPANFLDGVLPLPLPLLPSVKAMDLSNNGVAGSCEVAPAEEDIGGRGECEWRHMGRRGWVMIRVHSQGLGSREPASHWACGESCV